MGNVEEQEMVGERPFIQREMRGSPSRHAEGDPECLIRSFGRLVFVGFKSR